MTVRGTLGLFGLFAVLAVYLLLVAPPPDRSASPLEPPLLAQPTRDVTEVEVVWPDRRLRAQRAGGAWRLDGGGTAAAERIDDLLVALATLRPTTILVPSAAATVDYGLGPTATSLVLSTDGMAVLPLLVGSRNPALTGVYVRRTDSDETLLVGALLHWELEKLHVVATR